MASSQQHEPDTGSSESTVQAAAHQAEGEVFPKGGMPSKSVHQDPASCKHSEPALQVLEDPSASASAPPLLPEKNLKKIAVASSPCEDDKGTVVVASSASSVVTQTETRESVQANLSLSGNDGIPGYNVSAMSHRQNDAIVASELTDHPGELPRSPGTTKAAVIAPDAASSAVTSARAAVSPDTWENRGEQALFATRRIQNEREGRRENVLEYDGGGLVVDLRRARRQREDHQWSDFCLSCREKKPEVFVMPCGHDILCRHCFLDPHFCTDLVSVCPKCCRSSEGFMFTPDMKAFLIRRSTT